MSAASVSNNNEMPEETRVVGENKHKGRIGFSQTLASCGSTQRCGVQHRIYM